MLHAEGIDGSGVVVAHFLLLSVEAHALADDGGFRAGGAPDRKGHFEADGQDTLGDVFGTRAEGVAFSGGLVGVEYAFLVGGNVAAHVCGGLVGGDDG